MSGVPTRVDSTPRVEDASRTLLEAFSPRDSASKTTVGKPGRVVAPKPAEVLPISFYDRPVVRVARELIGCVVEHDGLAGVIVETEAYHETEPACHAFVGLTPRTSTLFGPPGIAYVYRSYGIHALLNAVCEPRGIGAAVLIRALQPLRGVGEMQARRARRREEDLCSGPGKLTQALGVELSENATSLLEGPVVIRRGSPAWQEPELLVGRRIGITKAVELPWRFCAAGSRHVSRPHPSEGSRSAD
jgi:DNA-3-methyladenine glycosylase